MRSICICVYLCLLSWCHHHIWLLIKIPLSRNGHSSRIKILLSRNFRELHVYLSRGPCWPTTPLMKIRSPPAKSAHTALAVKACLLGGNSNTKCSMTFVNIAVAISALAGGPKNGFAPRPEYGGVFDIFRGFLVSELKRVLKWNFGSFW